MENVSYYFSKSKLVVSILNKLVKFIMWITKGKLVEVYYSDWPAPPIPIYIQDATEIWIIVHTGGQLDSDGAFNDTRVKRVIFPCPQHNPSITLYAEVMGETESLLRSQIRDRSRKAQRTGAQVRWTDFAIYESMILLNPDSPPSPSTKILIDTYLPYFGTTPRPKYEVRSDYHGRLFSSIKQSFNAIWDRANDPKYCEKESA